MVFSARKNSPSFFFMEFMLLLAVSCSLTEACVKPPPMGGRVDPSWCYLFEKADIEGWLRAELSLVVVGSLFCCYRG